MGLAPIVCVRGIYWSAPTPTRADPRRPVPTCANLLWHSSGCFENVLSGREIRISIFLFVQELLPSNVIKVFLPTLIIFTHVVAKIWAKFMILPCIYSGSINQNHLKITHNLDNYPIKIPCKYYLNRISQHMSSQLGASRRRSALVGAGRRRSASALISKSLWW